MRPLGDLDEDELLLSAEEGPGWDQADLPPALAPLRRQLLLTRLILAWARIQEGADHAAREDQAARLAAELARLLDQVETEGLDFGRLEGLAPERYAAHWQKTLDFLTVLTRDWPVVQAAEGAIGPAQRRRRLLELQVEAWRASPPAHPVIAAGSTGSIPASAALIATVADLPQGEVVLPGLDSLADEPTWDAIEAEPAHPQHGLALLLDRLGIAREAVRVWPWAEPVPAAEARSEVLNLALRPAAAPGGLMPAPKGLEAPSLDAALAGLRRIDCAAPGEEALVIALHLREALEQPGRTAALVTPDRALARRVTAELRRWDVEVDDSAGVPLGDTPPGGFLRLTAQMAAGGLAPIDLLATLKHPLAAGGLVPGAFRARVRELEIAVLRGARPAPGFDGLLTALGEAPESADLRRWVEDLAALAAPLAAALDAPEAGLAAVVGAHVDFVEGLAAGRDEAGAARLWAGEAGEAAASFMAELREAAVEGPGLGGERYPALLSALMAARVVRPRYGRHPRLAILGPLEARLQHFDLLVLGGLNEGTWPAEVDPGPWFSRPMRADFGLPAAERRIGLSAHDFVQACAAPEVVLTRSTRVGGTPTVPSRWLLRIDALLEALGHGNALQRDEARWLGWAERLDRPDEIRPAPPPAPRPPLDARPRKLSVTQVETWMRDPYALYARHVLGLLPLEPLDADPGAAERGTLVHRALEAYLRAYPEAPPPDPEAALLALGGRIFADLRTRPGLWAFWWPRFRRIAGWFVTADAQRRAGSRQAWPEVRGTLLLEASAGPFRLTATADRIDLRAGGGLAILDYKTGAPPAPRELELGFAPQLPLEAAIAEGGGFPDVPSGPVTELAFWRLSGGEPAGKEQVARADPSVLALDAREGLARLVAHFDDPATAYPSIPRPEWAPRFRDYAHLAREKEWSAGTAGGEGGI
jgi:ATP-dependent helicase/nuclease subunit B